MLVFIIWFIIVGVILVKANQAGKREEGRRVKGAGNRQPQGVKQPRNYQSQTYRSPQNYQPQSYRSQTYRSPQGAKQPQNYQPQPRRAQPAAQQRKVQPVRQIAQPRKVQPIQPVRLQEKQSERLQEYRVMQCDAVLMGIGMTAAKETSEAMRQVNDLMIMGYQPQMTFERDFIGEGISMLNRYETLQG